MIHPSCRGDGAHSWSEWYRRLSYADGTAVPVQPDGDYTPDPKRPMPIRNYRRDCLKLGCDAMEIAGDLQPTESVVIDPGGSEALYRKVED